MGNGLCFKVTPALAGAYAYVFTPAKAGATLGEFQDAFSDVDEIDG
jgi:hypothetical protein